MVSSTSSGRAFRATCRLLIAALVLPAAVFPATIRVAGRCTLADAIRAANRDRPVGGCPRGAGADTLELTREVTLSAPDNPQNGLPQITSEITIRGRGHSIRRADGAPRFRIFDVRRGGGLTLEDLTVANGSSSERGGGIRSLGVVTLTNTTVSGNESDQRGGGIYARGEDFNDRAEVTLVDSALTGNHARRGAGVAAYNYTDVRINGSTVSNNLASSRGGGVLLRDFSRAAISNSTVASNSAASGAGVRATFYSHLDITSSAILDNVATRAEGGGVFSVDSDLRVATSRVSGNTAVRGGGIFSDSEYGEVIVRSSLVSNNTVTGSGGGIFVAGYAGSLSLKNSTLSGNSAESGGGLFELSTYYRFESEILHSTIVGNSAAQGAGIYASNDYAAYHTLEASLVAGNEGPNCSGAGLSDGGSNFDDDGSCPGAGAILAGVDFESRLADNGGSTLTHALPEGSVAIDAHDGCLVTTDQRLYSRDDLCDSGAFEFGAEALGASVRGVAGGKIYCKNLETGSRGKSSAIQPSWLCSELGVSAKPGERVVLWSIGTADGGGPVGGSVLGLEAIPEPRVVCRNRTTGEKVKFTAESLSWDCEAEGLLVAPGDSVKQKVKGQV